MGTQDPRWERMWGLFHAALALAPGGRAPFLDRECGGDRALRRALDELLESHEHSAGPLDRPPLAEPASGPPGAAERLVGEQVGPYRLLAFIAEGGMGSVYDAEQQTPIRRRVALKVIHPGLSRNLAARFAIERQALALMSHPNIARIFDAGVLPDGRPFLAMEHVAGLPLSEYCDRHALGLDQRIRLFQPVCNAIQHAHQKGVIHRDIKPSNILVAIEDGVETPKVIDFGVAKAVHPALDDESLRTRQEMLVGTLEYMSPEQLDPAGLDADTRSDIYSLGVVLFELLSGALPFDWQALRREGLEGLRRAAREIEPVRASRRVRALPAELAAVTAARRRTTPTALARALAGELDWILLKALDRDRTRRYGTASELAADLRRHLAHEAVVAGPPSALYRARKFVRRHAAAVATATAALVLLLAFGISTALQAIEVRRALARADRERVRAERVSSFLVDVFEASDPFAGGSRDVTARQLLDRGADRVARELASEPDVQAAVMTAIGHVYHKLRIDDSAERMLREALAIRRRLHASDHVDVAENLDELGTVLRGRADYAAASELFQEATAIRRRLFGPDDSRLAAGHFHLGSLRRLEGKLPAAEQALAEALRLSRGPRPPNGGAKPDLAAAILEELGSVAQARGDYAAAEVRLREALALRRRDLGHDAPRTAGALERLGVLLSERGEQDAAEPLLREALALLERHLGAEHGSLAPPLNNLALLLQNRGDYAEAEALYRRSLAIARRHGENHPSVAVNLNNLGLLLHDQGRFREAEAHFRSALAVQRRTLRSGHPDLAFPTTNLARVLHDQRRYAEAESLYRAGLELRRQGLRAGHPALGDSLAWLGKLICERGKPSLGEPLLREGVAVRAAAFAPDDWRTAEARSLLGACLVRQARFAEAEGLLRDSYPLIERKRGPRYRRTLDALARIATLYEAWGRPEEATRYRRLLEHNRRGL